MCGAEREVPGREIRGWKRRQLHAATAMLSGPPRSSPGNEYRNRGFTESDNSETMHWFAQALLTDERDSSEPKKRLFADKLLKLRK